jgi:hypothetical protein
MRKSWFLFKKKIAHCYAHYYKILKVFAYGKYQNNKKRYSLLVIAKNNTVHVLILGQNFEKPKRKFQKLKLKSFDGRFVKTG